MTNGTNTPDSNPEPILIEPSKASGVKTVSIKFWKKEELGKKSLILKSFEGK
jgi:hypothetical protein